MKPSERSAPRIVLDTQVLLRGAFARTESLTARIYFAWRDGRVTLLVSRPILDEIEDVLRRGEVLRRFRVTPLEAHALFSLIRRRGVSLTPLLRIQRCRDPGGTPILDPPAFWQERVRQS